MAQAILAQGHFGSSMVGSRAREAPRPVAVRPSCSRVRFFSRWWVGSGRTQSDGRRMRGRNSDVDGKGALAGIGTGSATSARTALSAGKPLWEERVPRPRPQAKPQEEEERMTWRSCSPASPRTLSSSKPCARPTISTRSRSQSPPQRKRRRQRTASLRRRSTSCGQQAAELAGPRHRSATWKASSRRQRRSSNKQGSS